MDIVNGAFKVAERPDSGPPIYRRADGRDGWLYVCNSGNWTVGPKEDVDARETSWRCCAYSSEKAQGRLPHEVGAAWKVRNGGGWIEQQLQVLHGEGIDWSVTEVAAALGGASNKRQRMEVDTGTPSAFRSNL